MSVTFTEKNSIVISKMAGPIGAGAVALVVALDSSKESGALGGDDGGGIGGGESTFTRVTSISQFGITAQLSCASNTRFTTAAAASESAFINPAVRAN
jgi:hypothetical protein